MTAVPARGLQPFHAPKGFRPEATAVSRAWSREWIYFVVIYAGWCFVPLVRRLIDWHHGAYDPITITSTVPFLLTLPLALIVLRRDRWKRMSPAFRLFMWVWVGTFAYGAIVALFVGNTFAAIYEAVQYLVPMLVGTWIAGLDLDTATIMRRLTIVMLTFGGIVGLYGLAQFVSPPPWDALWVLGGDFTSMGSPEPFQLRIFSTLNSAGPAADFFALGIIVALPFFQLKRVWIWPFVGVLGAALLLTLVRASWIALVVGACMYVLLSPKRVKAVPFIAIYVVMLSFLVASLPALLGATGGSTDEVTARLSTLGDVSHDDSALARSSEISDSFAEGVRDPIGWGLGQIGASSALSSNPSSVHGNNLDSGYMARFLELGWLGFAGYLFVVIGSLVTLAARCLRGGRRAPSPETLVTVATAAAMCAALAWGDAAGDSHLGLDGLFFWIALGIGLRPLVATGDAPRRPTLRRWTRQRSRRPRRGAMRIAITNAFLPSEERSGVPGQVHQLANALVANGHTVTVFTFSARPADARYAVHRYPRPPVPRRWFPFFMAYRLARTDFSSFDVVNAHGDNYLLRCERPLVRTFHGTAIDEMRNANTLRRRLFFLVTIPLERIGAARADHVVGVSETTRAAMPAVQTVIPCGVDVDAFPPGPKTAAPTVLFVGTEHGRKRGAWLADAFVKQVIPLIPNAELRMVSDGGMVEPGVQRYGRVTNEMLAELYRSSWAFCLPSTYEGFGVPYIEAMAARTTVVATSQNPGAREVLGDGAFGVLVADEALPNALVRVLSDPAFRAEMERRGSERSREYAWRTIAARYERVFAEVVAARSPRAVAA